MESLIAAYLAWIVAKTGLSIPNEPPIRFVSRLEMIVLYQADQAMDFEIQALYNRNDATILLPKEWHPGDLRQKSALLHELVHHVQYFNKVRLPCVAAYERQAYELQIAWLFEQGVEDPYDLVGINPLGIYLVSACRD